MTRLTINPTGKWCLHATTIPKGAKCLGTVTRESGDTGALIQYTATGLYAQLNAGAIRNLDGRSVAAALGTAGRPAELDGGKKVNVYLDQASQQTAAALGNGNVSEGIRAALRQARHNAW